MKTDAAKEHRQEAERLAQLSRADQAAVVAMYRDLADNAALTKAGRAHAKERAEILGKLLGLTRARKPAKGTKGKSSTQPNRKRQTPP